jgi:hypothetical protein
MDSAPYRFLLARKHLFVASALLHLRRRLCRIEVGRRLAEHLAVYDRLVPVDRLALSNSREAKERRSCAESGTKLDLAGHSPS